MKGLNFRNIWAATPPEEMEASHEIILEVIRNLEDKERRDHEPAGHRKEEGRADRKIPLG